MRFTNTDIGLLFGAWWVALLPMFIGQFEAAWVALGLTIGNRVLTLVWSSG